MSEFGRVCESRKLKVNVKKCKVLIFSLRGKQEPMRVRPGSEELEEVNVLKYLGTLL